MQGQFYTKDIPLTNVSQAYRPDETQFIAERVFPVLQYLLLRQREPEEGCR